MTFCRISVYHSHFIEIQFCQTNEQNVPDLLWIMVIVRRLQLPPKVNLFSLVGLFGKLNFDKTRISVACQFHRNELANKGISDRNLGCDKS